MGGGDLIRFDLNQGPYRGTDCGPFFFSFFWDIHARRSCRQAIFFILLFLHVVLFARTATALIFFHVGGEIVDGRMAGWLVFLF